MLDDPNRTRGGTPAAPDVERVVRLEPDPSVLSAIGRGHSLNSAVADLVDNSIDAGAGHIGVRFMVRNGFVESIRISDDGTGMSAEQLMAAMTLGKRRDYDVGALGHFGMGLKAASMSQGGCLQVFTSCGHEPIHGARMLRNDVGGGFDVDVLTEPAAWKGYHLGTHRGIESTGTVIEWSLLDAVSFAAVPSIRQKWLDGVINALRGELGLTFHRAITKGALRIEIDEFDLDYDVSGAPRTVDAVDPFDFHHSGSTGYPKTISAVLAGGATISAVCHILPPNSTAPAARLLGKSRIDGQGLYVYRNGRMLQSGSWHSLLSEHRTEWQLARVSIDLDEAALGAVAINPEKRGVVLRPEFAQALEAASAPDGTTFRQYLDDARETMQSANTRRIGPKPITALGSGLSDDMRSSVHEILGSRDDADPASISWRMLEEDRLFSFDHAKRILWMNAGYRTALPGADGLSLAIYLLVERHFAKERPQQSTLLQIEAWQRALALTTLAAIGSNAFDPTISEPDDEDMLPLFSDEVGAVANDYIPRGPTPADIGRMIIARRELDTLDNSEQATIGVTGDEPRAERFTRRAVDGELTFDGDHIELLASLVADVSDDPIADLRHRLNDYPLLTAEEEVSLARQIEIGVFARERLDLLGRREQRSVVGRELQVLSGAGVKAFDRFATSNLRLVFSLASKYVNRGLEYADLIQEGAFGLIRAIQKFDFMQGFKFSTYATWWIRQSLTRALADRGSTIRIPVHMAEQQNKLRIAALKFEFEHERKPTLSEVAVAADVSEEEVSIALGFIYEFVSIDGDVSDGEGDMSLLEALVDDCIDPLELLISAEFRGTINDVLDRLSERERTTIRMRYGFGAQEPKTLDHIGDIFGVTRERIRQIEKKTMEHLRASPQVKGRLVDFLAIELDRIGGHQLDPFTTARRANLDELDSSHRETPPVITPRPERGSVSHELSAAEEPTAIEPGSDAHIVDLYRRGGSLAAIEVVAGVDIRLIAIRLSRLLLALEGTIDDDSLAPRHGLPWEPAERERVLRSYRGGTLVSRIASDHGRTPLAIAWQLLDSPRRPVPVSKKVVRHLRSDHASRIRTPHTGAG